MIMIMINRTFMRVVQQKMSKFIKSKIPGPDLSLLSKPPGSLICSVSKWQDQVLGVPGRVIKTDVGGGSLASSFDPSPWHVPVEVVGVAKSRNPTPGNWKPQVDLFHEPKKIIG